MSTDQGVTPWGQLQGVGWPAHQQRYGDLEAAALAVRVFQNMAIPGQLQAREYVEYLLGAVVGVPAAELGGAVDARLARQDVSRRPGWVLDAVITEQVLRQPFGGADVMAGQLDHLADAGRQPGVSVAVVPSGTAMPETWSASFVLYEMPDPGDSIVLIELPHGEVRVTDPDDVETYRALFGRYQRHSVAGQAAIQFVQDIAAEMRQQLTDRRHAVSPRPGEGKEGEHS